MDIGNNKEAVGDSASSVTSGSSQNGVPSTQVIVVGVSTEVTVGIALASFVIGVSLTAILWCIHMRTGTKKQVSVSLFRLTDTVQSECDTDSYEYITTADYTLVVLTADRWAFGLRSLQYCIIF